MSNSSGLNCARCGLSDASPIPAPPFPGETGQRIVSGICAECWEAWKKHQMALINHYALNLRDAEARSFLTAAMEGFLFGGNDEAGTGSEAPSEAGGLPDSERPPGGGAS